MPLFILLLIGLFACIWMPALALYMGTSVLRGVGAGILSTIATFIAFIVIVVKE